MKIYLKATLAALAVGLVIIALFSYWKSKTESYEGQAKIKALDHMEANGIPDFEAKDLSGRTVKLSQFKDKLVILNFWASWCGPCVEEVPSLVSLVEAMHGKLQLVAISGDSTKEDIDAFLKAFPKMKNPNISIIWDEDRSVSRLYNVDRLPESFVTAKDLKLSKRISGGINWHTKESETFLNELWEKK